MKGVFRKKRKEHLTGGPHPCDDTEVEYAIQRWGGKRKPGTKKKGKSRDLLNTARKTNVARANEKKRIGPL